MDERFGADVLVRSFIFTILVGAVVGLFGCNSDQEFIQSSATQFFTQDYNPEYFDVLWMVDDRSNLSRKTSMRNHLISEARNFFVRLDQMATSQYNMAFVTGDIELSVAGQLKPKDFTSYPLRKNIGSVDSRANLFASLIGRSINLRTGGYNQGFESVRAALNTTFIPQADKPLILIFITDGDDASPSPVAGMDPVDYYANAYKQFKLAKPELLRIYTINYFANGLRCATEANADIDKPGFKDSYFRLANLTGGTKADLCAPFSSTIDLSGIKSKELPKRFHLDKQPVPSTIKVTVTTADGVAVESPFHFEEATNEIVFDVAPVQGSTISVTFLAK